jgi:hypothetical protein
MSGVISELKWALQRRKKPEQQIFPSYRLDSKTIELETAKEILREVFGTTFEEVEEMIRLRMTEREDL